MNAFQTDLHREELTEIKISVERIGHQYKHVIHVPENITGHKLKRQIQAKVHALKNMRLKAIIKNQL